MKIFIELNFFVGDASIQSFILPATIVEGSKTNDGEPLSCSAQLGYPGGSLRTIRIEQRLAGESSFQPFSLANAVPTTTNSSGLCELNQTVEYKGLTFSNSYNNSVLRCSVYDSDNSQTPLVTKEKSLYVLESE